MSLGDKLFLLLVIGAFGAFAVTLAGAAWFAGRGPKMSAVGRNAATKGPAPVSRAAESHPAKFPYLRLELEDLD